MNLEYMYVYYIQVFPLACGDKGLPLHSKVRTCKAGVRSSEARGAGGAA